MKNKTCMFVSIAAAALAAFDLPADFKADANADVFRIAGRQHKEVTDRGVAGDGCSMCRLRPRVAGEAR